jgi:hypothetical protein
MYYSDTCCTLKLDCFSCTFRYGESLRQISRRSTKSFPIEETYLPTLTRVMAEPSRLLILIPGWSVRNIDSIYSSLFTSTSTSFMPSYQNPDCSWCPYVSLLCTWRWTSIRWIGRYCTLYIGWMLNKSNRHRLIEDDIGNLLAAFASLQAELMKTIL